MMMITLSGEQGGGQILRSALSLAMATGRAVRVSAIRGQRPKPGLMRQHLTCVQAAVEVSQGAVDGAVIGSSEILFHPGEPRAGDYHFAIGTAGSTTLLAQTLLPVLWSAEGASRLTLEGGTHNPMAPPMDYLLRVYLPMLRRMGVTIEGRIERHGFAPAGGGRISFEIPGGQRPRALELCERGAELGRIISCLSARVPATVPGKETSRLRRELGWPEECVEVIEIEDSDGPGNVLAAEVRYEHVNERVSACGEYGKPSSRVALEAARMMKDYLATGAVVGRRLADQLLLPLALGEGGTLLTMKPSRHVVTNKEVIQKFLTVEIDLQEGERGQWRIVVAKRRR